MKRARGKNKQSGLKKKQTNSYDIIDVSEIFSKKEDTKLYVTKSSTDKSATTKNTGKKISKKALQKKRRKRFFLFLILAVLIAFFALMGIGGNSDEGALIPVDMNEGKLNVLLLGVDKEGLRTDAIMLVSYDLHESHANILSIPRDTQMKVTDRSVTRKINEIHAMHDKNNKLLGPMGSIKAVTALTSIPIHYYVELNFNAIDDLANAIGPIEFDVPDIEGNGKGMNYDDPTQDLHIHLKPGLQKLKGNQVQQFLRYRKSNSQTVDGSDTSRVARQQEFLKAVIDQKVNLSLIAKVPSIYSKLKKNIKTNFSLSDAVKYSKYLTNLKSADLNTYSLPGDSKNTGNGWYFICDLDDTATLIQNTFGYTPGNLTNKITVNDISGTKNVLSSKNSSKDDNKKEESNSKKDTSKDDDNSKSSNDNSFETSEPKKTPTPEPEHDDEVIYDDSEEENEIEDIVPTKEPTTTATPKPTLSIAPVHTPPLRNENTPEPTTQDNNTTEDGVVTLD